MDDVGRFQRSAWTGRPFATSAVGDDALDGEKERRAIVEKHFDVSWLELDCDARANLFYYLVDHGKVEEEDIAFTDDGGAFAADGAQPGSEGDAGWVAMLE